MPTSADDQLWPSRRLAEIAMARLTATGHTAAFADELVCCPDAGHRLGLPGMPTVEVTSIQIGRHSWLALGGTPAGIARAAHDSFRRTRASLATTLR